MNPPRRLLELGSVSLDEFGLPEVGSVSADPVELFVGLGPSEVEGVERNLGVAVSLDERRRWSPSSLEELDSALS